MANPNEIDPNTDSAGSKQSGPYIPDDKVYRLTRRPPEARGSAGSGETAKPEAKVGPADRKPEARPSAELPEVPAAGAVTPKKSLRRPLMFALLPVALMAGGYFYVTGGAAMSTDNAYVQADMVGLSTDVAGIVTQVLVHDNQKVAKGDILFKLDPCSFNWRWIEPRLRSEIHATISLRFSPVTATCRPRLNRGRKMLTSTWSTSSARSN